MRGLEDMFQAIHLLPTWAATLCSVAIALAASGYPFFKYANIAASFLFFTCSASSSSIALAARR